MRYFVIAIVIVFSLSLSLSHSLSIYMYASLPGEALTGSKGPDRPNVQSQIQMQRPRSSGLAGQ